MPQLIFIAAVGVAAWMGYKALKKGINNANETLRKDEKKQAVKNNDLKQDPKTGVYKVTKNDK